MPHTDHHTDHHDEAPASRIRKPLLLATAAVGIAALAFGGGTLASALFTSQTTVTGQSATTATVVIEAGTATTSAPIALTSMLPGDTASTVIELENTGTEAVFYTVRLPASATGDAALESAMQVTVAVGAATETRSLTAWQLGAWQVGPALAAAGSNTVTVTVSLPIGTADTVQGLDAGFSVQFDAIQQRNMTAPTAGWVAD